MTRDERSNLILSFARVLYNGGESAYQTLAVVRRLGDFLGVRATLFPNWGELQVQIEDSGGKFISAIEVAPSGVNMDRVASALRTVDELCEGRLSPANAMEAIHRIAEAPPASTGLFTLAAAVDAVALAVLFGIRHLRDKWPQEDRRPTHRDPGSAEGARGLATGPIPPGYASSSEPGLATALPPHGCSTLPEAGPKRSAASPPARRSTELRGGSGAGPRGDA
jgi:hypothetical protein